MSRPHVVMAIPTRETGFYEALGRMEQSGYNACRRRVCTAVKTWESGHSTAVSRNRLAMRFLQTPGATHLWFVDDDTLVPPDALERLLACDADIATGVTPFYFEGRIVLNVQPEGEGDERTPFWDLHGKGWPRGRMQLAACGTACILIARRVFETMKRPWFVYYENPENGHYTTEDVPWCWAATRAGFRITCDAEVRCDHLKCYPLSWFCPPQPTTQESNNGEAVTGANSRCDDGLHSARLGVQDRAGVVLT